MKPGVEAGDELGADVFAWVGFEIVEGSFEDVFFFAAPAETQAGDEVGADAATEGVEVFV